MQVGEIGRCAGRTIEGLHVCDELNQIARYETCGQPQVTEDLHEQPARVAARAAAKRQRLFGCLHSGSSRMTCDVLRQLLVQINQEFHRSSRAAIDALQQIAQLWADRRGFAEREEVLREPRLVLERVSLLPRLRGRSRTG